MSCVAGKLTETSAGSPAPSQQQGKKVERHAGQPSPEGAHVTHIPRLSHPGAREAGRVQVAGQSRENGAGFSRCFLPLSSTTSAGFPGSRFVLCNSASQLFLKRTFHRATHLPGLWHPLRQQGEWPLFGLGAKAHKPHRTLIIAGGCPGSLLATFRSHVHSHHTLPCTNMVLSAAWAGFYVSYSKVSQDLV